MSGIALASPVRVAQTLPALVDRAASALASARTAAEVLEARDMASIAYDVAKRAARLAKAKAAHDDLIAAVYRAQADALEIEAQAKRRLADEYDAAQERGEVRTRADNQRASSKTEEVVSVSDIGLTHKAIHEARQIRDAEQADPGIVKRTVNAAVSAGEEPTKAKLRSAILSVVPRDHSAKEQGRDAICIKARNAIAALAGLPPGREVAAFFRGRDDQYAISDNLAAAIQWLAEFRSAWEHDNAGARD